MRAEVVLVGDMELGTTLLLCRVSLSGELTVFATKVPSDPLLLPVRRLCSTFQSTPPRSRSDPVRKEVFAVIDSPCRSLFTTLRALILYLLCVSHRLWHYWHECVLGSDHYSSRQ